jgi:MFS family permease
VDRLRKRDQLLSLKYSTIEACFSVPMLNLTLPNFPFVVAFAVSVLGWRAEQIGLMAALPHICNCIQPMVLAALARRLSTFRMLVLTFTMGALPWSMAWALPSLGSWRDAVFIGMLVLGTIANSIAAVAWSSAISELVPERLGGRYFARRNLVFGLWTLVAVMIAGQVAQWKHNSLQVFGWIFGLAGTSRLIGLFFLTRMKFPQNVMEPRPRGIPFPEILAVLRDQNYFWLCLFVGFWGLLLNMAMPFYTMFLVGQLSLGIGTIVKLTTLASLGGLLTLKGWGLLCDRFGNRPVLQVAAFIWALTALIMWSFARPGWTWHLYPGYLVVGAMTAGFQLTQFNLMVRLAPAGLRPAYVAVFLAITSLFTAFGPIFGGEFLRAAPAQLGTLFKHPVFSFHALFILTAFGCLLITHVVQRVREPAEQPIENVWRGMRQMRTFNPMLSVLSVGELLLTPRGLVALARRSLRSVRQQVKAIEDVGEELALGGKELLRRPGKK